MGWYRTAGARRSQPEAKGLTMTMKKLMVACVAILGLAACNSGANNSAVASSGPVAAVAPPAGTEWATTVSATSDGGFLMGNPNAPIKLMEYGSVTCPTCQAFSIQGAEPLKAKYIATGKVSYEFRSFLIHGPDVMATSLLQCGGPEPFFALLEASYASPQAELARIQSLPIAAQNVEMARISGLDQFVIQRGIGSDAAQKCLTDPTTPDKLVKQRDRGTNDFGVQGTPTFFINGKIVPNVASWKDLEPELRAAGA
jgi:protein-disulfide isomerase